ncbi:MAG: protein-disulfide reductase DsbD N-terminal domain-containing protein [Crocinitomicaceae bacterium]|nr:protein-disulfide reductase DsbD N-terminal domain-containing protein [Crocinitomicaceae bacterium]
MPKSIFFLLCLLFSFSSFGQEEVAWTYSYDSDSETITITAEIEEGWHLYSQYIDENLGPVATAIQFEENKDQFKLVGKTVEPTPITEYDKNFEGELSFFKDSVKFTQKLKLKTSGEVRGTITYMICTEEMCLPPVDIDFNLMINKNEK